VDSKLTFDSGFVAADALFSVLNDRITDEQDENSPIFPLIQGILTFDTPYNGLARSMFVYGAFSNYQKVSSVFNVMTAITAAAPSTLSKMAFNRSAASLPAARSSNPAWKSWQLIAVKTGTVGAIAAGGVAAYMHRKEILEGVKSMRNLNKDTVKEGYQQSVDALGQVSDSLMVLLFRQWHITPETCALLFCLSKGIMTDCHIGTGIHQSRQRRKVVRVPFRSLHFRRIIDEATRTQ
jgi:hypothetical protein